MRTLRVWFFTALVAGGLCASTVAEGPAIDLGGLTPSEGWVRINARPFRISAAVEILCRRVQPNEIEHARAQNPHATAYVTVYVNRAGADSMSAAHPEFPEGSVIVKQKYYSEEPPASIDGASLYTVMIKRGAGYNPSVGDWEFAVVAGDGKRVESRGKLSACMACHESQPRTDYVYRTYREMAEPGEARE